MKRAMRNVGRVLLLAALAGVTHTAYAHVNTHGVAFHNYNAKEDVDIDYLQNGVRNLNTTTSRYVIASLGLVRSNGGSSTFTIDGKNALGTSTSFTLAAYNNGLLRKSVSVATGPGAGQVGYYSTDQTLTTLDQFSKVHVLALLPANTASVIYGVTQIQ